MRKEIRESSAKKKKVSEKQSKRNWRIKKRNFDLQKTFYTFAIHKNISHMAIIKSAFAIGAKGKFGNMRLSTQNNRIIGATQPSSYRDANTDAQKSNRNGLKSLIWFSEFVAAAYKVGFAKYKGIRSEYNEFVSRNKTVTQNSTDTEILPVNYGFLTISDGPLSAPEITTETVVTGTVTLNYNTGLIMPKDELTDLVSILIVKTIDDATPIEKIDYAQKEYFFVSSFNRSVGSINIALPPVIVPGDEVAIYLFFTNTTTKECSPTTYRNITAI